ncbi:putative bifunctional diguanylate cyclase/phosphodiesterase [Vibrio quintilis]|uniref:Cyclic di-GMP phosphodiesterase Gmr n=1 Tax=Vibrio quintilis TaxID=1117707 RepID=A0A1M7Z170_9VIBR|nr:bifunctional diguanylate cyclase/phosphodiesterase [Vibrio quintilis]SHO58613.1 Cyclic di-GMP phosphodiesterase Gmr [Vibrio quintilis]
MLNINVGGLVIPEALLDNWHTIVNLTTDLLKLSSAAVYVCRNDNKAEELCGYVSEDVFPQVSSESVIPFVQTVMKSHQPLWFPDPDNGKTARLMSEPVPTVSTAGAFPLFWPTRQLFGVFVIAHGHDRVLTGKEHLLLENYRQTIEFHLAGIYQQAEIRHLNHRLEQFQDLDYKNLTDFLCQEIDRRKVVEQQLRYHKHYDSGTGFLNRFSLDMKLRNLLSVNQDEFALIYIGFQNAYVLQSQFGYQAWDDVLRQYRKRLASLDSRFRIMTARPNSTDLILIVESEQLISDLEKICHILSEQSQTEMMVQQDSFPLRSYVGVATAAEGQTAVALIEEAFSAMLSCKDSGDSWAYSSELLAKSPLRIHQLENFLYNAVKNENMRLYFQPKVCPDTYQWQGAEALLRWQHPVLGDISNETLIHLAEKNGLIFEIGAFVLRAAISKASQWRHYAPVFKMAVNISARQLCDVRLVEQVKQFLDEFHLPASYLEIEVTESALITDETMALEVLERLHALGITLSLDDFGTGYASFSYLKKYPFDCIKIDKSFIHSIEHNDKDREIVRSIIQIAGKLDLQVIAEGIETQAQEQFAIREGCSSCQGFLYGRPMPSHEFEKKLIQQELAGCHSSE